MAPGRGHSDDADGPIPVGYVRRAHGVRGDVVVRSMVDDAATRLVVGASFATDAPEQPILTIEAVTALADDYRILFAEVSDRTHAEELRGVQITIPASERRLLPDDEWWPEDLIGCQVITSDGSQVGTVHEVIFGSAQDRLVVVAPDGSTAEVPFVEALVPTVDIAHDRIFVELPSGLFE
ncbi:MAG: ribosome maturation factor RimM [Acidimicrobiia bacterium]